MHDVLVLIFHSLAGLEDHEAFCFSSDLLPCSFHVVTDRVRQSELDRHIRQHDCVGRGIDELTSVLLVIFE